MISTEQLQQWRALAAAATPGPLTHHGYHVYAGAGEDLRPHAFFENTEDAALYAAAREAVPALLAEVDRLNRELASYKRHTAYVAGVVESEGRYIP